MSKWRDGRTRAAACVFAALLACARAGSAQPAFPAHDVRIVVTLHDAGTADVVEAYALTGSPAATPFSLLESPCTDVGSIAAAVGSRPLTLGSLDRSHAPWTQLRLTRTPFENRAGEALTLRYGVRMSGRDATVPIALPAAVLQRADGARGASVQLDVRLAGGAADASVLLPRLERAGADRAWTGRFLAIPAFVRVHLPGGGDCDRPLSGRSGGLEWRTAIFTGTMAVWVPIYLWWFGRWRRAS